MSRNYPLTIPGKWSTQGMRQKCNACERIIRSSEIRWVIETQVSWFRGDDEVEFFCVECAKSTKDAGPTPQELRLANQLRELAITEGKADTEDNKTMRKRYRQIADRLKANIIHEHGEAALSHKEQTNGT